MPKLLNAVEIPNRRVSILSALPEGYATDLAAVARSGRIPASELLGRFIDWGWDRFAREEMIAGLATYRAFCTLEGLVTCAGRTDSRSLPVWLRHYQTRLKLAERKRAVLSVIRLETWGKIADAISRLESEFYAVELSEVLGLYFAWGWFDFVRTLAEGAGGSSG